MYAFANICSTIIHIDENRHARTLTKCRASHKFWHIIKNIVLAYLALLVVASYTDHNWFNGLSTERGEKSQAMMSEHTVIRQRQQQLQYQPNPIKKYRLVAHRVHRSCKAIMLHSSHSHTSKCLLFLVTVCICIYLHKKNVRYDYQSRRQMRKNKIHLTAFNWSGKGNFSCCMDRMWVEIAAHLLSWI